MELIYSMRRKPLKCEPPHFESTTDPEVTRPICTISSANIIAFSSPTELSDTDGDTWGGHVYVCDLDTPWDSHKVTSTTYAVSTLEWDNEGRQLLVATTAGEVSVYGQKDYLLNEWTCLSTVHFPGEHIIGAIFFDTGRRVVLADTKKHDAPIQDKVLMLRATPTLKGFGGVGGHGVCVVTQHGAVGVVVDGVTASESLRCHRDRLASAALATCHTGKVLVAAVCGRRVRGYSVSVLRPRLLSVLPLPAICLGDDVGAPSAVTWLLRDDVDSLLVAGKSITVWKLTERAYPVHKLLHKGAAQGGATGAGAPGQKTPGDAYNTVTWQRTGAWAVERGPLVSAASCRGMGAGGAAGGGCALVSPLHVHLLQPHRHQHMLTSPVVMHGGPGTEVTSSAAATPPKKTKYGPGLLPAGSGCARASCVAVSALGGALLVLDTHSQLHLYKMPHAADSPSPLFLQPTSTLLEYSLVSGVDCLDVLLTLKPQTLDALYDRLTESFQRQPQAFQQYYYQRWIALRCTLLRLIPTAQWSASSLTALQSVQYVWAGCNAALRLDERADAATAAALDDTHATHSEKSVLALEARGESPLDLVSLRRPLRRAVDTVAHLLASLHHQGHKYDISSDPSAISLLRKLLVLGRWSGQGGGGAGGVEALQRPLVRLAACKAPPQDLIEECASITAQLNCPRIWESLPRCSVSSPHERPYPLYFEYGVEPEALRYNPEPPAQFDTTPSAPMDSLRYMYIGGAGVAARWRQCGRCGTRALAPAYTSRHPLQRAYDARFLPCCRCGGKWTLVSNV